MLRSRLLQGAVPVVASLVVAAGVPAVGVVAAPSASAAVRLPAPTPPTEAFTSADKSTVSWRTPQTDETIARFEVRAKLDGALQLLPVTASGDELKYTLESPAQSGVAVRSVVVRDGVEKFSKWSPAPVAWGLNVSSYEASTAGNQTLVYATFDSPQLQVEFYKNFDDTTPKLTRVANAKYAQATISASGSYQRVVLRAQNKKAATTGDAISVPVNSTPVYGMSVNALDTHSVSLTWLTARSVRIVDVVRTDGNGAAATPNDGVPVQFDSTGVDDSTLQPGREYTYTVFSTWGSKNTPVPPVSITARTPHSNAAGTSWVLAPGTVTVAAEFVGITVQLRTLEQDGVDTTRVFLNEGAPRLNMGQNVLIAAGSPNLPTGLVGKVSGVGNGWVDVDSTPVENVVPRLTVQEDNVLADVPDEGALANFESNVCRSSDGGGKLAVSFEKVQLKYYAQIADGNSTAAVQLNMDVFLAGTAGDAKVECEIPNLTKRVNFNVGPVPAYVRVTQSAALLFDAQAANPWSRSVSVQLDAGNESGEWATNLTTTGLTDLVQYGVYLDGELRSGTSVSVGAGRDLEVADKNIVLTGGVKLGVNYGYHFDTMPESELGLGAVTSSRVCVVGQPFWNTEVGPSAGLPFAGTSIENLVSFTSPNNEFGEREVHCGEPVREPSVTSTWRVSAGSTHSCAVTPEGQVYCWGDNTFGQLGTSRVESSTAPIRVLGVPDVSSLEVGDGFTCAVTTAQELWCWGSGRDNQFGDGPLQQIATPTRMLWAENVTQVAVSSGRVCVTSDGSASCRISAGTTSGTSEPVVRTVPMSGITSIKISGSFTCAQDEWGALKCFDNEWRNVTPGGLGVVSSFSLGEGHVCAVANRASGRQVVCWGDNEYGQLGDGSFVTRSTPAPTLPIPNPVTVHANGDLSCATTDTSDMYCWGDNPYWVYNLYADEPMPTGVPSATPILVKQGEGQVDLGSGQVCSTTPDGAVSCLGEDATEATPVAGSGGVPVPTPVDEGDSGTSPGPEPVAGPPSGPGSVLATPTSSGDILITWSAPKYRFQPGVDTYDVAVSASADGEQTVYTVTENSLTLSAVTPGQVVFVAVSAKNASGSSLPTYTTATAEWAPVNPQAPTTPGGVNIQTRDSSLYLTWSASGNSPSEYLVYYSTNGWDWGLFETNPTSDRNSLITGLTNGTRYWVRVVARNTSGSSYPGTFSAIPAPRPTTPTGVKATPTQDSIMLEWEETPYATRYAVRWRVSGTASYGPITYTESLSFLIPELTAGERYDVSVAASNTTGTSTAAVTYGVLVGSELTPQ